MKRIILFYFIFISCYTFSQNVFILGRIKSGDIPKIEQTKNILDSLFKIKTLSVFYNSYQQTIYLYNKASRNSDDSLNFTLSKLVDSDKKITSPTEGSISTFKLNIYSAFNTTGKLAIIDLNGNGGINEFLNNVSSKLDSLKKSKVKPANISLLIIFKTMKPRVFIAHPKNGDTLTNRTFKIKGSTSEPFGEVYIRLNDEKTFKHKARIEAGNSKYADWEFELNIEDKTSSYDIHAIALNQYGETSEINSIKEVKFIKKEPPKEIIPTPLPLHYYTPKKFEVVEKCMYTYGYYIFTFSINSEMINIDSLSIIIEKDSGEVILEQTIGMFKSNDPQSLSPRVVSENRTNYCLFINWKDLGFKDACSPDDSINYNYYFKYGNAKYIPSPVVEKIHFPSFDGQQEEGCNCE